MRDIEATLNSLTLEEKCQLLAGKSTWRTHAFSEAGRPQIKMSDGPNGIRGEGHGGSASRIPPPGHSLEWMDSRPWRIRHHHRRVQLKSSDPE
jgi:hypothetical protein